MIAMVIVCVTQLGMLAVGLVYYLELWSGRNLLKECTIRAQSKISDLETELGEVKVKLLRLDKAHANLLEDLAAIQKEATRDL